VAQDFSPANAIMRLFIAADLSDEAKQAIAAEQKRIAVALGRSGDSVKLVRPGQMHLTLLFLGEVPEAREPAVVETMNIPVDRPAFEIAFGGAGVFPPRGAPRVLWIGVTTGAAPLTNLQSEIAGRIRRLGIEFNDRPFHPHLTIGRWRESRGSGRRDGGALRGSGTVTTVRVTRATLYQSQLSSSGPAYTALAHANLSDNE
jgi:2'-5' RNA ligase